MMKTNKTVAAGVAVCLFVIAAVAWAAGNEKTITGVISEVNPTTRVAAVTPSGSLEPFRRIKQPIRVGILRRDGRDFNFHDYVIAHLEDSRGRLIACLEYVQVICPWGHRYSCQASRVRIGEVNVQAHLGVLDRRAGVLLDDLDRHRILRRLDCL